VRRGLGGLVFGCEGRRARNEGASSDGEKEGDEGESLGLHGISSRTPIVTYRRQLESSKTQPDGAIENPLPPGGAGEGYSAKIAKHPIAICAG
jgi:hypothetical protein